MIHCVQLMSLHSSFKTIFRGNKPGDKQYGIGIWVFILMSLELLILILLFSVMYRASSSIDRNIVALYSIIAASIAVSCIVNTLLITKSLTYKNSVFFVVVRLWMFAQVFVVMCLTSSPNVGLYACIVIAWVCCILTTIKQKSGVVVIGWIVGVIALCGARYFQLR
jgi:hypothetical protein